MFAGSKFLSQGSQSARSLQSGHFLCLLDKVAQPRGIVVMAIPSPVKDFDNGKWAAVFYGPHKSKNFTLMKNNENGSMLPMEFSNSGKTIRTVMEGDEPMFVAKDVFDFLEITWDGSKSLVQIPVGWRGVGKLPTPSGIQAFITINEAAMYKIAFRSNKPEADKLTNWVASEVLPTIRKTGSYSVVDRTMRIVQIAEGILLNVLPSENHVWIISTGELSRGLKISEDTIRSYKTRSNFKEEDHYILDFPYLGEDKVISKQTMWTKKGVMEMPNHLRTGYCNELRRWAENQLIGNNSAIVKAGAPIKRRHNRITPERMLSIMATITRIPDASIRAELVNQLMEGGQA